MTQGPPRSPSNPLPSSHDPGLTHMTASHPVQRDLLPGWQRPALWILLGSFLVMGVTGIVLLGSDGASAISGWSLVLHVVASCIALPVLVAFTVAHARAHLRRKPAIAVSGALVLFAVLAVVCTGAALVFVREAARPSWTGWVHGLAGALSAMLYPWHRRAGTHPAPWSRLALSLVIVAVGAWVLGALEVGSSVGARPGLLHLERAAAGGVAFAPSSARLEGGTHWSDTHAFLDVASCASCHEAIVRDHMRSAHRHASMTNVFYQSSIRDMRRRHGVESTKWCAGCHDPALLFTEKMTAPELDVDCAEAQAGVTCLGCHAIETQGILGNGDYVLRPHRKYMWETHEDPRVREAHELLLRMKPEGHTETLRPDGVFESRFCGTCHRADLPAEINRWHLVRAQTEYDDHDDSGVTLNNVRSFYHPKAPKRCQDCHMPLRPAPEDPAADASGYVRSHLFAAANTALPYLRGDEAMIAEQRQFLRTALLLDVGAVVLAGEGAAQRHFLPAQWSRPTLGAGEVVEVHLVVRNKGVGHRFPAGTSDSNEIWVHFEAAMGDDAPFYVSGAVDPTTRHVDPTAEFYRSYAMDREGNRFVSRVGADIYTPLYAKRMGPGTADVVRYRFRIPEAATGTLNVRARVRYRKFMQPYVDRVFGGAQEVEHPQADGTTASVDLRKLPIIDMAETAMRFDVLRENAPGAPRGVDSLREALQEAGPAARGHAVRVLTDLGIAYFLQKDLHRARAVWSWVPELDPDYADGWVNVARVALAFQDFPGALRALAAAKERVPDWAKARFFEGRVYQQMLRFRQAEQAYRDVLTTFPRDRMTLRQLARVLWEMERGPEALVFLDRLLQINPRDADAWFQALAVFNDLGDAEALRSATEAYQRFRPDDALKQRQGAFLNRDPNLQRLARPIHVHRAANVR